MNPIEISQTSIDGLSQVMGLVDSQTEPGWTSDELTAMLEHQLLAPLAFDLGHLQGIKEEQIQDLAKSHTPVVHSFNDLLTHEQPSMELLIIVKEYAKASMNHPAHPLPKRIATVIYYSTIVVAQLRCNQLLTQLDNPSLRRGLRWALDQPWLDNTLRALLQDGLERFAPKIAAPEPNMIDQPEVAE